MTVLVVDVDRGHRADVGCLQHFLGLAGGMRVEQLHPAVGVAAEDPRGDSAASAATRTRFGAYDDIHRLAHSRTGRFSQPREIALRVRRTAGSLPGPMSG